jgi:hypothetical protein
MARQFEIARDIAVDGADQQRAKAAWSSWLTRMFGGHGNGSG